jgi:magnesium chelatase family protein
MTALEDIKGQSVAKRALAVAWAGNHTIMLTGPRGTGKASLRDIFFMTHTTVMDTCACGNYNAVGKLCTCNERFLTRWRLRFLRAASRHDITVECPEVPTKYLMDTNKGETLCLVETRVSRAVEFSLTHKLVKLGDTASRLLEMASRRMAFTPGDYDAVIRVGRTIANMDQSDELQAKHLAEAIQYRSLQRQI